MAKVELRNLTKRFGDSTAVNNVNLTVEDKEFLVLLGPSGCGKTTTLRCIAGLETPDQGEIYIGGKLVNDLPPKARDIAMVFQSYALYPHMKVFDNIAFPLRMQKVQRTDIEKKVKHTAELLKITHLLNRRPRQLSGGEAQRVALGRAIIRDPKVFLMDEPLSNLDAKLRIYMRAELKRLQKELGVTTVYVTHDQVEAMTMADKVAIMNLGVLQQLGDANDIFHHPSNLFVAGFIGSPPMNLIDCTIQEKNGSSYLDAGTFSLPLPENITRVVRDKATSSELILGFRCEDVSIERDKASDRLVETEVYVTEPTGSETIVDLRIGSNIVKAKAAPDFLISIGDRVWMGIKKEKMYLFDKKTGKAIA